MLNGDNFKINLYECKMIRCKYTSFLSQYLETVYLYIHSACSNGSCIVHTGGKYNKECPLQFLCKAFMFLTN